MQVLSDQFRRPGQHRKAWCPLLHAPRGIGDSAKEATGEFSFLSINERSSNAARLAGELAMRHSMPVANEVDRPSRRMQVRILPKSENASERPA